MKKVKVTELSGPALDWAVAKCEGFENLRRNPHRMAQHLIMNRAGTIKALGELNYTTDWAQGGPIIEREEIWWSPNDDAESDQDVWWCLSTRDPVTLDPQGLEEQVDGLGPTLLVAAMRCYVASKLGDEIEIPKELL